MSVSNKNANDYFRSEDEENCPITSCYLQKEYCTGFYLGSGVKVAQEAPYAISGYSGVEGGWKDAVCLVCSNKDETK